jgi:CBS-domain-containing membrane protein
MLKKLLILFSIALVVGFTAGFYYWRQVTGLPEWYHQNNNITEQIAPEKQTTNIQVTGANNNATINLDRQDINRLLEKRIAENSQYSQLLRSAKSIQANLDNNILEVGGVFNASEISKENLDETQKVILDKTLQSFPQLKNIDIYVGIVGQPRVENGHLILERDSKVKVGKLSFRIDEFAQKFGLSTEQLQQYLNLEIARLNIQELKLDNDKIIIEINQ